MISTHAQLLAVLEEVLRELPKIMAATSASPALTNAKRVFEVLHRTVSKKKKPSKSEIRDMQKAAKAIRAVPLRMPELHNKLWDIEDFVEAM